MEYLSRRERSSRPRHESRRKFLENYEKSKAFEREEEEAELKKKMKVKESLGVRNDDIPKQQQPRFILHVRCRSKNDDDEDIDLNKTDNEDDNDVDDKKKPQVMLTLNKKMITYVNANFFSTFCPDDCFFFI